MSDDHRSDKRGHSAQIIPLRRTAEAGAEVANRIIRLTDDAGATLVELVAMAEAHGISVAEPVRLASSLLSGESHQDTSASGAVQDLFRPTPSGLVIPILAPDGRVVLMHLDRRAFLRASGSAAALLPLQLFTGEATGLDVVRISPLIGSGDETLSYLQIALKEYVRGDALLGPQHLVPTISEHLGRR